MQMVSGRGIWVFKDPLTVVPHSPNIAPERVVLSDAIEARGHWYVYTPTDITLQLHHHHISVIIVNIYT